MIVYVKPFWPNSTKLPYKSKLYIIFEFKYNKINYINISKNSKYFSYLKKCRIFFKHVHTLLKGSVWLFHVC